MRKAILIVVLLILATSFGIATNTLFKESIPTAIGQEVPDFTLETLNGEQASLSDFRGKRITLIFFTTWCDSCRIQQPYMKRFTEQYGEQVELLYIDRREPKRMVEEYADEFGITATIFLDENDSQARKFGVIGQPEALLIDENGILLYHHIGPLTDQYLISKWKELVEL